MSSRPIQLLLRIALPVLFLAIGLGSWYLLKNETNEDETPRAQRRVNFIQKVRKDQGLQVELNTLEKTSYQIIIPSRGETEPSEETELITELEGEVLSLSDQFQVGRFVRERDVLLELDKQDLMSEVAIAESRVAQSEATLAQEQARAKQAELNWDDMGYTEPPGDLVLRKPQLKQAAASLKAAKAQSAQAKRRLERATIRAPYDGVITEKTVSLGQRITRGRQVGTIIATRHSQISLPIAVAHERFLPTPLTGSKVVLKHPVRKDEALKWEAEIMAREPVVDSSTKQLHVIATIHDPFALSTSDQPVLSAGHPVTAEIYGQPLEDVFVIPKSALRSPDTIHIVASDLKLKFLTIDPLWTDDESIVFRADLEPGSQWVGTVIRRAFEGKLLAPIEAKNPAVDSASTSEGATSTTDG